MNKYNTVLSILLFFVLSSLSYSAEIEIRPTGILASTNGRYVYGQISNFRRDQYMLDTHTGMLWILSEDKDKKLTLEPILYDYGDDIKYLCPADKFGIPPGKESTNSSDPFNDIFKNKAKKDPQSTKGSMPQKSQ
jgi:hypothetical protein